MNNKDYWYKRTAAVFDENYSKKAIKQIYKKSYSRIEDKIIKLYEELKGKDGLTTTQLYQYERYRSLLSDIEKQSGTIKTTVHAQVNDALNRAYKDTFNVTTSLLGSDSTWSVQNQTMLETYLNTDWDGSNFSKRIWGNTAKLEQDLKANISTCLVEGTNKDTLVKTMMDRYNVGFNYSDRLIRTELAHVINTAQVDTYKSEGVQKVEWYAAEDERMCGECGALHEQVFDIEEMGTDVEVISHPGCRCTLIPVLNNSEV